NARLHDKIIYSQAAAEKTNFKSRYFDLITVAQAVHWFDFEKFYAEVDRTAKPGAILSLIGYGQLQVNPAVNRVMEGFYWDMFNKYFTANRQLVEKRYETIPFPYHEVETPDFSIDLKWTLSDLHGYLRTWSPVVKYMTEYRQDPTTEVISQLDSLWGAQQDVSFPVFLRVGKVFK
ncbi:MAG: class I SAM-dependent methyltransferase, partial [Bacteroidota bacterium]